MTLVLDIAKAMHQEWFARGLNVLYVGDCLGQNAQITWSTNPSYNARHHHQKANEFSRALEQDPSKVINKTMVPGEYFAGKVPLVKPSATRRPLKDLCIDAAVREGKQLVQFHSYSLTNEYASVMLSSPYKEIWTPTNGEISVVANRFYDPMLQFMLETSAHPESVDISRNLIKEYLQDLFARARSAKVE